MRIAAIKTMRIPASLMLLCCEIASILILRGQPNFHVFLPASLAVILLILPLFWIQEIWRQNISYFVFAYFALGAALYADELLVGKGLPEAPFNLVFVLILIGLIRKSRQGSKNLDELEYRIRMGEDIRFFWVCINLAGILTCLIYLAYHPDGRWANLMLPIAFLFLCGIVYCLFVKQVKTRPNFHSSQEKLDSGTRA